MDDIYTTPIAPFPTENPMPRITEEQRRIQTAEITYGRRLDIMLASHNWSAAHAIIEEAQQESKRNADCQPFMEVSLMDAGVPEREANALEEACGIGQIGHLMGYEYKHLFCAPGFGSSGLNMVWWSVLKYAAERDDMRAKYAAELEGKER